MNIWQSNQSKDRLLPDELSSGSNHISLTFSLCVFKCVTGIKSHFSSDCFSSDAALSATCNCASAISWWKSHWWGVNLSSPFSLCGQLSSWDRVKSCPRPKDASLGGSAYQWGGCRRREVVAITIPALSLSSTSSCITCTTYPHSTEITSEHTA